MGIDPDIGAICFITLCAVTQAAFGARQALAIGKAFYTVIAHARELAGCECTQAHGFRG